MNNEAIKSEKIIEFEMDLAKIQDVMNIYSTQEKNNNLYRYFIWNSIYNNFPFFTDGYFTLFIENIKNKMENQETPKSVKKFYNEMFVGKINEKSFKVKILLDGYEIFKNKFNKEPLPINYSPLKISSSIQNTLNFFGSKFDFKYKIDIINIYLHQNKEGTGIHAISIFFNENYLPKKI